MAAYFACKHQTSFSNSKALKQIFCFGFLLLAVSLWTNPSQAQSTQQTSIAIIIDDVGNNLRLGQRALRLPGPVTFAVLPHSRFGERLAHQAHQRNKEILVHMPMGNTHGRALGPGGLTDNLSKSEFKARVESAIAAVPHAIGMNNHMGSLLTQNDQRMGWLMQHLKERTWFFLDSRTTAASVAEGVAQKEGIPTLRRHVFLDHDPSLEAIDRQFKRLLIQAHDQGFAVAIGHPHATTLGYLETVLPRLDALGVRLVSASGMLLIQENYQFPDAYLTQAALNWSPRHKQPENSGRDKVLDSERPNNADAPQCAFQETSNAWHFDCAKQDG